MKKLAKIMAVFAAIMMALAFAGCNNDDDDDPSTVAVYNGTDEDGAEYVLTFYDDNTLVAVMKSSDWSGTGMTGTYTGDPSKDGTIAITVNKLADENGKLADVPADEKEYLDSDYEIKDGKITIMDIEFTRQ